MCTYVHVSMYPGYSIQTSLHEFICACVHRVCLSHGVFALLRCCSLLQVLFLLVHHCFCLSLFVSVCLLLGCCSLLSLLFLLVPVCVCWCLSLLKGVLFYYYSASFMHACIDQVQSLPANQVFSIATLSGGCTR